MSGLVYLNGILMEEREGAIPLSDRSYLYGEGLFETMKATDGFIPFIEEHLDRLFRGMDLLQFQLDLSRAKLQFSIYQTLFHNQLKDAYIRVNLSRPNRDSENFRPEEKSNLVILVRPLPKIPPQLYERGCSAIVEKEFRIFPDPLCQVKSTNYLRFLLLHQKAFDSGAHETLILNTLGRVTEGATTNLFIHDGSAWVTPPIEEGLLPGVTRQVLIDLMRRQEIPLEERAVELGELEKAHEAILTNSIRGIMPLSEVDGQQVGKGVVGDKTNQLMAALKEEIQFRLEQFESRRWGVKEPL